MLPASDRKFNDFFFLPLKLHSEITHDIIHLVKLVLQGANALLILFQLAELLHLRVAQILYLITVLLLNLVLESILLFGEALLNRVVVLVDLLLVLLLIVDHDCLSLVRLEIQLSDQIFELFFDWTSWQGKHALSQPALLILRLQLTELRLAKAKA